MLKDEGDLSPSLFTAVQSLIQLMLSGSDALQTTGNNGQYNDSLILHFVMHIILPRVLVNDQLHNWHVSSQAIGKIQQRPLVC